MLILLVVYALIASVNADCNFLGKDYKNGEETVFRDLYIYKCIGNTMTITHCLIPGRTTKIAVGEHLVEGITRSSCIILPGKTTPTFSQNSSWVSAQCEGEHSVGSTWSDVKFSYICEEGKDKNPTKTISGCVIDGGSVVTVGSSKTVSNKIYECKKLPNGSVELVITAVKEPTTQADKDPEKPLLEQGNPIVCSLGTVQLKAGEEFIYPPPGDKYTFMCLSNGSMIVVACVVDGKKLEVNQSRVNAAGEKWNCIRRDGRILLTMTSLDNHRCEGNKTVGSFWHTPDEKFFMTCTANLTIEVVSCLLPALEVPVGTTKEQYRMLHECKKFPNGTVVMISTDIIDENSPCIEEDNSQRRPNSTWNDGVFSYICTFNTEKKQPEIVKTGCVHKNNELIKIGEKKEINNVHNECVRLPNGTVYLKEDPIINEKTPCIDKNGVQRAPNATWLDIQKEKDAAFTLQCTYGGNIQIIECIHKTQGAIKVGEKKEFGTVVAECKKFPNGTVSLIETDLSCKDNKGNIVKPGQQWEVKDTQVTWECENGKPKVVFCKYLHFGMIQTLPYMGRYRVFEKEQRCEENGMLSVEALLG